MDKQTLSNYGWLVIVTLILAVMLALATPFGTYVGDAVVSVANGFVGANDQAIDENNIKTNGEKWDNKFDYSTFDKEPKYGINHPVLNPNGIIPENAVYIRFNEPISTDSYGESFETINYERYNGHSVTKLVSGDNFPIPHNGDMYVVGEYVYCYNGLFDDTSFCINEKIGGWGVGRKSATMVYMSPSPILETIAGVPITSTTCLFFWTDITGSFTIPSTVKYMNSTCRSFGTETPIIITILAENPIEYNFFDSFEFVDSWTAMTDNKQYNINVKLAGNETLIDTIGQQYMYYCSICNGTCDNNH